jgi:hypothetical protein
MEQTNSTRATREFWFWTREIANVLDGVSDRDLAELHKDFMQPGMVFEFTMRRTVGTDGKESVRGDLRVVPADGNKEIAEELIKLAPKPTRKRP